MIGIHKKQVVIFFCQNMGYKKADLGQLLRLPHNVSTRFVELPCSGKIEPQFLLKIFETGIDAIFVLGCLDGTCHHVEGNRKMRKRVQYLKDILGEIDMDRDRLEMFQISSDPELDIEHVVSEIDKRITSLSPSPLK
ncbi:MAG TPA: hydrogenase iron-sulfur subunit [Syntrophaceae bacterium]|nr:hydrogenase iron-sulfur subunit [Syntrophaceae bacterium]